MLSEWSPTLKHSLESTWLQIYTAQQQTTKEETTTRARGAEHKQGNNEHNKREAKQGQPFGSSPPVHLNNRVCPSPNILFSWPGVATILKT